jgi:hypothetical protein
VIAWRSATVQTFPRSVHADIQLSGNTTIRIDARRDPAHKGPKTASDGEMPIMPKTFSVDCPVDSEPIDLWPVVSKMIAEHKKHREDTIHCGGELEHSAKYEIRIKY